MRYRLRLKSYTLYLIIQILLDLCDIDRVFLEFRKNDRESILEPESLTFNNNTLLEVLVMLDSMRDFPTRIHSFSFDGVYHVVRTFIAESHNSEEFRDMRIEN